MKIKMRPGERKEIVSEGKRLREESSNNNNNDDDEETKNKTMPAGEEGKKKTDIKNQGRRIHETESKIVICKFSVKNS